MQILKRLLIESRPPAEDESDGTPPAPATAGSTKDANKVFVDQNGTTYANSPEEKKEEQKAHKDYYLTQSYYDHYLTHPYMRHTLKVFFKHIRDMLERAGSGRKLKIVEVGCGGGIIISQILSEFELNGYGFDISFEGAYMGKQNGRGSYFVSDAESSALKNSSMDIVVLVSVIHHFFRYPEKLISESLRVLKPGGLLLIQDPNLEKETPEKRAKAEQLFHHMGEVYSLLSELLDEKGEPVQLPPPPPDLPTEHHVPLTKVLEMLSANNLDILEKGYTNFAAFLARKYPFGFGIAEQMDEILNDIAPRMGHQYYIVARKSP